MVEKAPREYPASKIRGNITKPKCVTDSCLKVGLQTWHCGVPWLSFGNDFRSSVLSSELNMLDEIQCGGQCRTCNHGGAGTRETLNHFCTLSYGSAPRLFYALQHYPKSQHYYMPTVPDTTPRTGLAVGDAFIYLCSSCIKGILPQLERGLLTILYASLDYYVV